MLRYSNNEWRGLNLFWWECSEPNFTVTCYNAVNHDLNHSVWRVHI